MEYCWRQEIEVFYDKPKVTTDPLTKFVRVSYGWYVYIYVVDNDDVGLSRAGLFAKAEQLAVAMLQLEA